MDLRQKLYSKVEPQGECLVWKGGVDSHGYGRFMIDYECHRTHRVVYSLFHGPIAPGLSVCHHCDTPRCIRVDHLFLGTQKDNLQDMWAKGRGVGNPAKRGLANPRGKLSDEQVDEIRARYDAGAERVMDIATSYGVHPYTVTRIGKRRHRG